MEENAVFTSNTGNVRNWLNRADLIVGVHHGNQNGLRGNRTPHVVRIDAAVSVHRQVRHCGAQPVKEPARIDDSGMFHLRCDEVSFGLPHSEEHALQLASLPPLVKTISFGLHSSRVATWARAFSRARFAGSPAQCPLEGLPNGSAKTPCMASATSGAMGVLALKSKYMRGAPTGFSMKVPLSVIAVVRSCDVLLAHMCLRFLGRDGS